MKIAEKMIVSVVGLCIFVLVVSSTIFYYQSEMFIDRFTNISKIKNKSDREIFEIQRARFVAKHERLVIFTIFFVVAAISLLYVVFLIASFSRRVLKPLLAASEFSRTLATGVFPAKINVPNNTDEEVKDLFRSMNFLRDRLYRFTDKLRSSHEREVLARRQAESINFIKSHFLAKLAPELSQPLNNIIGNAELLAGELATSKADPALGRKITVILKNAITMNLQISEALKIAELDTGENSYSPSTFTTEEIANALQKPSELLTYGKKILFAKYISPDFPQELFIDKKTIAALLNILLNIIASTVESDETVQINFKVVNNKICFSMHEHGSNPNLTIVAEKFLQETGKHTFERMQNADSNLLCLLLLERKAVEINAKFSIKVSDRENSEFMLEFERGNVTPKKIARQAPPIIDNGKDTVILSFPEEQNSPLATMHDANIIIADPDHDGNAILKTLLENDGANIEEVDNSQTLVEKLKTKQYHLLIMSYSLIPTANFLTFLKYLMEQQKLPVVITANQLNGTERQGLLLAGVERCMVKPLDFSLIRRVAVKICTKQQIQQIKDSVDIQKQQQSAETTSTPDALL